MLIPMENFFMEKIIIMVGDSETSVGIEPTGLPEYHVINLSTIICQSGSEYQFQMPITDYVLFF